MSKTSSKCVSRPSRASTASAWRRVPLVRMSLPPGSFSLAAPRVWPVSADARSAHGRPLEYGSPLARGRRRRDFAFPLQLQLPRHQRAGAVVGEELQQHRVLHAAVEDDDAFDALLERIEAGL